MAEKISLEQVNELLAILRTDASIDNKVQHVTLAKSGIKQHNVPDNAVAPLFEALRTASTSQHAVLVNAGFTGLNHLLTRLSRQEPKFLIKEAARTLPLIIDKLGDQKDKFRAIALQSLTTLYLSAPVDVERSVRNTAMAGKNPRAKESSMQWLLQMHHEQGLQFRAYVPVLMDLLEDADGMVRDAAKATVIELFRNAPNGAKTDLKKQLKNFKVRPAIEQAIVKELAPTSSASAAESLDSRPESRVMRPAAPSNLGASVSSLSGSRPVTPLPDSASRPEQVEPTYVNTNRELDEIFREMSVWFEGRETEQNWLKREESMTKLRRLIAGNASDFQETFLMGVRALLDGVIKAMISLRTSLSKEGCSFVQDLAHTYGPAMDPMVELLMQTLIKLSAGTKKISSQQANVTIDAIVSRVTYNTRLLQHIWGACQDKNVQPRSYASEWLKTVLNKESHHKERIEHAGGLDIVEKCIKKGLVDPNPGVRERMRSTYWVFAGIWPARAETIMSNLEATAQKLLQNDPNNPNPPPKRGGGASPARPGLGLSKSTMGSSKPSLRETMMAKKKEAMAARNLPTRPGSAMAHFSPSRNVSGSSNVPAASAATGTSRQRAEGGLSVAPQRPAKRRPELHARPATAGPYSVRTHDHPSVERASPPERVRPKAAVTPKTLNASPKRTGPRPRPGHQTTASEPSVPTPSRGGTGPSAKSATASSAARHAPMSSPRTSPSKPKLVSRSGAAAGASSRGGSPSRSSPLRHRDGEEAQRRAAVMSSPPKFVTPAKEEPPVVVFDDVEREASSPPLKVYEDPFSDDQSTPKAGAPLFATTVLEDKPINEDAANLVLPMENAVVSSPTAADVPSNGPVAAVVSPEKAKQNVRLLDSGITRVKAQTLDVHGFRKLQGIIRDAGSPVGDSGDVGSPKVMLLTDERFDALLLGLFAFLEAPLAQMAPEKGQDVKAQILATIRLLLKKARSSFQPHVSRGLEALLAARATYDARTHIVAGLELLADELVTLGDASEIVVVLTRMLGETSTSDHALSMGLHVLKVLVDARPAFQPTDTELSQLSGLALRCLESTASGVRLDAVQLCVAMHERVGDGRFWGAMHGVRDDPKSLITYYIVKRQRETEAR